MIRENGRAHFLWLCIAAAPAIFALATWAGSQSNTLIGWWLRVFALPVAAIELVFVVMAIGQGAAPMGWILRQSRWVKGALAALALISIVESLTAAPRPIVSLVWTLLSVIHLLFGVSVAQMAATLRDDQAASVWRAIAIGVCAYVGIIAAFYLTRADASQFDWEHLRLGTNNIRHTGHYAIVGMAVAFALGVQARGRLRLIYFGAACLCMTLAFWSGTRGAIIAIWVGLFATMSIVSAWRSWQVVLQAVAVTVFAGAVAWFLPAPHALMGLARISDSVQHSDLNSLTSFRPEVWKSAWALVMDRPLLGHGLGQFGFALEHNRYDILHPHNVLLQSLVQWGAVGTALLAFLLGRWATRLWSNRMLIDASSEPAVLVAASLGAMAMYDGTLFFTYPTAMVVFALAWVTGQTESRSKSNHCD